MTSDAPCLPPAEARPTTVEQLDRAAARPVVRFDYLKDPVVVESLELLRNGKHFLLRARSIDGAEGLSFPNGRAAYLYPILLKCVAPYFIGKDARDLESLVDGAYVHASNYKLAGLALFNPIAWVEFALLDLMGRIANRSIADMFGGAVRRRIPIYVASGRRDTTPEEEVDLLARRVEETGARAIKFKVGGRMSRNADSMPGRTDGLVPLARRTFGDAMVIHADSNGSYDAPKGIEVGRFLEKHGVYFFEEPCPFDHLDDTRAVADALTIPVAAGEQETSLRRFRWTIHHNAVQVVQPDVHYNGGFIRTVRVARMAAEAGLPTTPHISGALGCLTMVHFASFTPNIGEYMEYKSTDKEGGWFEPPLRSVDGYVEVPTAPGLGLTVDPAFLRGARQTKGE
ncbi:mandelate racemase/muconate lactonizing enzyme family protein [Candidatus Sumerlaeota bacterium]|nr:mandelate racemase/muconate lactonizing enzyme family protein [Candidatus Sumerlaeota bacterium]